MVLGAVEGVDAVIAKVFWVIYAPGKPHVVRVDDQLVDPGVN